MKPQDFVFLALFLFLLWKRSVKLSVFLGLFCLFLAMPLFQFWVFFTAERLTWYSAGFLLLAVCLIVLSKKEKK